jgi:energy-converting hydrogenase B subunit D
MMPLQVVVLGLVAAGGLAVVLARDPLRQAIVVALYGLLLAALFMVLQAPDVVLSMLGVGSIAYPLVILIAVARVRDQSEEKTDDIGK